jgi:hypothetical protein
MRKILIILFAALILSSCANSKVLVINNQETLVKPYGWANKEARYNEKVVYETNLGNVVWSILGFQTIVLPVWLTGWQLFEPVKVKEETKVNK